MCGVAGFWSKQYSATQAAEVATSMAQAISHRGPDGDGVWSDEAGIVLAHRRLAIVDLTAAGRQPMVSRDGRWVLCFNGEIYNYRTLRKDLETKDSVVFRSSSDTEVLLEAIACWGITEALVRSTGMFAITLWDRQEKQLTLAVDRFGEKPLYFGWSAQSFLFASELAALKQFPAFAPSVCPAGMDALLRYGYIGAPNTIYQDVEKLAPGHFVTLTQADLNARRTPEPRKFWDSLGVAQQSYPPVPDNEVVDRLETLLKASVGQQLHADVPVGAFLSGGIDSSAIVCIAQQVSAQPVRTFTIGFDAADGSEAQDARLVAEHLGTDHTEVHFSDQELLDLVPQIPTTYSEPFADSSQLPTTLVSQAARRSVTVALSGDAGDELFAGYSRYLGAARLSRLINGVPSALRQPLSRLISATPAHRIDAVYRQLAGLIQSNPTHIEMGDKLHKVARALTARSEQEAYELTVTRWHPNDTVVNNLQSAERARYWPPTNSLQPHVSWMMGQDTVTYMPGGILTKVDRAAMSTSLETRVPFLDPAVYEFAWSLNIDQKIRDGKSKWPLRELLQRYMPASLIDRPKAGFGVPIDMWLRGPLKEWANDLLSEHSLINAGLDAARIRGAWALHLSGKQNLQQHLWPVLMLQQWLQHQKSATQAGYH